MEPVDFFRKLRDISGEVVEAYEKEDAGKLETGMGKFMYLMVQADCLK
jgi:hypothetical protein